MDLQDEIPVGQPVASRVAEILRSRLLHVLEISLVGSGRTAVDLVGRQDVGLASEPADPFQAPNKPGKSLGSGQIELRLGGTFLDEFLHFLGQGPLHFTQSL